MKNGVAVTVVDKNMVDLREARRHPGWHPPISGWRLPSEHSRGWTPEEGSRANHVVRGGPKHESVPCILLAFRNVFDVLHRDVREVRAEMPCIFRVAVENLSVEIAQHDLDVGRRGGRESLFEQFVESFPFSNGALAVRGITDDNLQRGALPPNGDTENIASSRLNSCNKRREPWGANNANSVKLAGVEGNSARQGHSKVSPTRFIGKKGVDVLAMEVDAGSEVTGKVPAVAVRSGRRIVRNVGFGDSKKS